MKKKLIVCLFLLVFFLGTVTQPAYANSGRIVRGVVRTLTSVFEIPKGIISHSRQVVFPVGIVTGTVAGTFRTVVGTVAGAADIAIGAAPYAKYALLFL